MSIDYAVLWINLDYVIGNPSEFTDERFFEKASYRILDAGSMKVNFSRL